MTDPTTPADTSEFLRLDRRRLLAAFDRGALTAVGVSLVYGLLIYPVGLTWGLIAVAVAGGWLIGKGILRGAWAGGVAQPSRILQALAAALGVLAWLGAFAIAYIVAELLLVSDRSLLDRLSIIGYWDYIAGTYDLFHAASLGAIAIAGWWSTRWTPAR
ncbi:MAG TPA: hypothetical protein VNW68_02745 [Candidatus Limnocylindria bacterium]|jgi:hypothetical protein|nr:hypothetical protein [Candidatus Limnocylindria bacterium]